MKINISKKLDRKTYSAISECMKVADGCGVELYLVGGIVRDMLLERKLKDVDITVIGDAKKFVEILESKIKTKSVKYNEKLPTAKVEFKNGVSVDFASTRQEAYAFNGALPNIIKVGCSLKEDVMRRDFTVNTLALSLNKKNLFEVIDYLGGIDDLKKKQLRVLHKKSYLDDPSRMVRCLKFALRLGFTPEEETLKLQRQYLENPLKDIPLKRVKKEIRYLFSMNKTSAFYNFIKMRLYKILDINYNPKFDLKQIRAAVFEFDVEKEDVWLLYFLPLFIGQNPPEKLNLKIREIKIINELNELLSEEHSFADLYDIYEYFKNKDYLSVVFYGVLKNLKISQKYMEIKDVKTDVTGLDLKLLGIAEGPVYKEIQDALIREKLMHDLNGKFFELAYVREHYCQK